MKRLALHWKIIIGLVLGIIYGVVIQQFSWGVEFTLDWIKPFGKIFVKLLKLIAVPLIIASLIKGISDLKDISKFKSMGLRTIVIYIVTTITAITIGLSIVNVLKPGDGITPATVEKLKEKYAASSGLVKKMQTAQELTERGPLDFVVDIVPDNAFAVMGNNRMMLQVIFFTIFLGLCMLLVKEEQAKPLKDFFDSLNEVILKMVDVIMLSAPYAVFSLLATVVVSSDDPSVLLALLKYAGTVFLGLVLMIGVYLVILLLYTKKKPLWFLSKIAPAQLLAFSTSSSAATLPVTMERVEEHVGVDGEVASFVLPVGATINMDGTSLYQAVAAVFIMQVLWPEGLVFQNQLVIIFSALMASIGSAAVPGVGMVMLVIVLESVGFPSEMLPIGLALIFAVDRPLDMCRTTVNITGDATVSTIVAKSLGKLHKPEEKAWDDHLKKPLS